MAIGAYEYKARGRPIEVRFWEKVDKSSDPDACWTWQAARDHKGYGLFNAKALGTNRAQRVAYILEYGELPDGTALDHRCQNPPCVNPKHLRPVTTSQNSILRWKRSPAPKPETSKTKMKSVEARFWEKVNKSSDPDACWPWKGYIGSNGCGMFSWGRPQNPEPAYRVAFKLNGGVIAAGMQLDHLCRYRACVNPSHLEPVTPSENQRRRLDHHPGTFKCGHEATPENIRENRIAWVCRECNNQYVRERNARIKGYSPVPPGERTQCPQGHPYDEENTGYSYKGTAKQGRYCKECRKPRWQEWYKNKKGYNPLPPPGERTHCPKGHPYNDANTYRDKTGRRHCRECRSAGSKSRYATKRNQAKSPNS